MSELEPRKNPCASCPYRRDVPAGVWHPDEYAKLPPYDLNTAYQPAQIFMCHQQDGHVCSGWLGCNGASDLLGVRLAVAMGRLDPAVFDYQTDVPLFASGTEAAAHGLSGVFDPDARAQATMNKIERKREIRGDIRQATQADRPSEDRPGALASDTDDRDSDAATPRAAGWHNGL